MDLTERDLRLISAEITRHRQMAALMVGRLAQDHTDVANALSRLIDIYRRQGHGKG